MMLPVILDEIPLIRRGDAPYTRDQLLDNLEAALNRIEELEEDRVWFCRECEEEQDDDA